MFLFGSCIVCNIRLDVLMVVWFFNIGICLFCYNKYLCEEVNFEWNWVVMVCVFIILFFFVIIINMGILSCCFLNFVCKVFMFFW